MTTRGGENGDVVGSGPLIPGLAERGAYLYVGGSLASLREAGGRDRVRCRRKERKAETTRSEWRKEMRRRGRNEQNLERKGN